MNLRSNPDGFAHLLSAVSADQPDSALILKILAATAEDLLEVDFVTLSSFDVVSSESERLYSTRPEQYPVHGKKPVNQTRWTDWVIGKKKTFVANSTEEIAEIFFDHDEITKLGCQSIINIPVVFEGNVIGTVNCLGPAAHFTEDRAKLAETLKLPATLVFLALRAWTRGGSSEGIDPGERLAGADQGHPFPQGRNS